MPKRTSPFSTGRTFDAVGRQLAEQILDQINQGDEWNQFLLEVLTGDRDPRELVQEFQDRAEGIYDESVSSEQANARADQGDMFCSMAREDECYGDSGVA